MGDIDNAIASLTFTSGKLGVVDLTRSGIYGYDISTEILGLEGTIRIGYLRETPIMIMTKANGVSHDTVPYFMERFRDAYTNQLQNFAQNVLQDREPPITIDDGIEALRIGVAATRARERGKSVRVADVVTMARGALGPVRVRRQRPRERRRPPTCLRAASMRVWEREYRRRPSRTIDTNRRTNVDHLIRIVAIACGAIARLARPLRILSSATGCSRKSVRTASVVPLLSPAQIVDAPGPG